MEVRHWIDKVREYLANSNQTHNAINPYPGSETTEDKPRGREGNSPDHQLRSLSVN
jgi:hypothetical protein